MAGHDDHHGAVLDVLCTLTPTLALAYEEKTGADDIGSGEGITVQEATAAITVGVNLGYNAIYTMRAVQIQQYRWGQRTDGTTGWQALTMNEALGELDRRYPPQPDEYVRVMWLTWYGGQVNYVAVNGQTLVGPQADDAALYAEFNQPAQPKLPGYVRAAYHLDS
jgi:hypothetical protein